MSAAPLPGVHAPAGPRYPPLHAMPPAREEKAPMKRLCLCVWHDEIREWAVAQLLTGPTPPTDVAFTDFPCSAVLGKKTNEEPLKSFAVFWLPATDAYQPGQFFRPSTFVSH